MAGRKQWIVTTSPGSRSLSDVKQSLSKTGFTVDQVFQEIGSITGSASDAVAKRLRALPGVADVSPVVPVDIGPPDSSTTW
jgi:hypothetical protein